ncbi:trypco2 family protein [Nocardia sp. NPDC049526]|uniref:trypco2 family protein n=1 Tax=Nocardia sp. NPDC049526 TaxID=3364316 RepID=UPI0037A2A02A
MTKSSDGPIEFSDMIKYLKSELATAQAAATDDFKLKLDECSVELNIAVKREGKAGIKAYVVTIGGGLSSEQTHKVTAKFRPFDADSVFETGTGDSPSTVTIARTTTGSG